MLRHLLLRGRVAARSAASYSTTPRHAARPTAAAAAGTTKKTSAASSSAATPPTATANAAAKHLHNTLGASHEAAHDLAPRVSAVRQNSSMAAAVALEDDELESGPSAASTGGATRSNFEDWMINLRGGVDDAWLQGPRDLDVWYTGARPLQGECPGVGADGKIRSLPLPNLAKVTRASTLAYFDNSWTLMETMFAGLKGEEPFYRPPVHGLRHPQIF